MGMKKKNIIITEQQLNSLILGDLFKNLTSKEMQNKILDIIKKQIPAGSEQDIDFDDIDIKDIDSEELKTIRSAPKKSAKPQVGMLNKDFYEKLLQRLGAPITDENLKFLYAWRQSEGDGGKYNPFNTTLKKPGSTFFNYLNSKKTMGVQNYPSEDVGIQATVDTLKHNRYNCITDGLKQDIGASEISSKCASALKTWGTGDLISKVLAGYDRGASIKVKDLA